MIIFPIRRHDWLECEAVFCVFNRKQNMHKHTYIVYGSFRSAIDSFLFYIFRFIYEYMVSLFGRDCCLYSPLDKC